MAARSLNEMPITFDCHEVAVFSSSPMVVTSRLRGERCPFFVSLPTVCSAVSSQQ